MKLKPKAYSYESSYKCAKCACKFMIVNNSLHVSVAVKIDLSTIKAEDFDDVAF